MIAMVEGAGQIALLHKGAAPVALGQVVVQHKLLHEGKHEGAEKAIAIAPRAPHGPILHLQAADLIPEHCAP